jgi:predicted patatin/cPLA2 family phospholipase
VETDGEKLQAVYELGRQDGEAEVVDLKKYMEI